MEREERKKEAEITHKKLQIDWINQLKNEIDIDWEWETDISKIDLSKLAVTSYLDISKAQIKEFNISDIIDIPSDPHIIKFYLHQDEWIESFRICAEKEKIIPPSILITENWIDFNWEYNERSFDGTHRSYLSAYMGFNKIPCITVRAYRYHFGLFSNNFNVSDSCLMVSDSLHNAKFNLDQCQITINPSKLNLELDQCKIKIISSNLNLEIFTFLKIEINGIKSFE